MRRVDVGFVGCGFMGQLAHLANFARDPRVNIVAIADFRPQLASKVADKYSIPEVYGSHSELLEKASIEALVEITPDDLHAPVGVDALKEGKHVYTEKPLAPTSKEARRMVKASSKNGVHLQASYMKQYDLGVEIAKEQVSRALSDGSLGDITYAKSHGFGGDWICNLEKPITTDEPVPPHEKFYPEGIPSELQREYRNYLNVFCHNLNLLRHLVGNPKRARFASFHPQGKILNLEYNDFPAIIETGWLSASFWDEHTQIYFRDGRVDLDTPPPLLRNVSALVEVYRAGTEQSYLKPLAKADWSFRRSAEHFIDCILNDTEPRTSGRDSIVDIELIEGAFVDLAKSGVRTGS
jgi:predicted dehydrogenase